MKRWNIITRNSRKCILASLVSMDAKTRSCIVKTDDANYLNILFGTFPKYAFGVAKEGTPVLAQVSILGEKVRRYRLIVFK